MLCSNRIEDHVLIASSRVTMTAGNRLETKAGAGKGWPHTLKSIKLWMMASGTPMRSSCPLG